MSPRSAEFLAVAHDRVRLARTAVAGDLLDAARAALSERFLGAVEALVAG